MASPIRKHVSRSLAQRQAVPQRSISRVEIPRNSYRFTGLAFGGGADLVILTVVATIDHSWKPTKQN
jgi:hypothetical protein